jgi:hypothetical protein
MRSNVHLEAQRTMNITTELYPLIVATLGWFNNLIYNELNVVQTDWFWVI